MKKIYNIIIVITCFKVNAQVIFNENFDNFGNLMTSGWTIQNSSEPMGSNSWGTTTHFAPYNGALGSFAAVNYQSTGSLGTISNWLISPVINLKNGDIVSFYSRTDHGIWPDRLELRISLNGATSVIPSPSSNSLGDFTTLALTINPDLIASGYPTVWTNYTYTVSGLSQPTDCRIGFRYYVTNAGSNGDNGDLIGIDALNVTTSSLNNSEFNIRKIRLFPNPTQEYLTIENIDSNVKIHIYDMQGKRTNITKINDTSFDVTQLSKGTYLLKIEKIDNCYETLKFIKD